MKSWTTVIVALAAGILASAVQAEVFVYPKPGQSQDAFQKDQYECHNWAKQQTGFDPRSRPRRPRRRRPYDQLPPRVESRRRAGESEGDEQAEDGEDGAVDGPDSLRPGFRIVFHPSDAHAAADLQEQQHAEK